MSRPSKFEGEVTFKTGKAKMGITLNVFKLITFFYRLLLLLILEDTWGWKSEIDSKIYRNLNLKTPI